jgi:hypothetical protein
MGGKPLSAKLTSRVLLALAERCPILDGQEVRNQRTMRVSTSSITTALLPQVTGLNLRYRWV